MLIESIIKREGGTVVEFDTRTYHFMPDEHGRHVCEVDVPSHAKRLLEITEGYRPVSGAARQAPAAPSVLDGDLNGDGVVNRTDVVLEYEQVLGKKPHHKMSIARMREEIDAARSNP